MRRLFLAATMLVGFGSHAFATPSFSVHNVTLWSIGADYASDYDTLVVTGYQNDAVGTQTVANLGFTVGPNCIYCSARNEYLPISMTVGGDVESLNLLWYWSSDKTFDTLKFSQLAPVTFTLASGDTITASFDPLKPLTTSGGTVYETLVAHFDTIAATPAPEPMSMALLGVGFAGIGLVKRKRNIAA